MECGEAYVGSYGWDKSDAFVICKQLGPGYTDTGLKVTSNQHIFYVLVKAPLLCHLYVFLWLNMAQYIIEYWHGALTDTYSTLP